jgi:hypothetical protein
MAGSDRLDGIDLMAHFTVSIGADGPAVDAAVSVSRAWQGRLVARGKPVPSPVTVRALNGPRGELTLSC